MRLLLPAICLLLSACASSPMASLDKLLPADAVLLGEQHDAQDHQRWHHDAVQALASRGALAALALEMAEQGTSTAGLPRDADEAAVRAALRWNDEAWPWKAYGPAVMAALKSGVPVLGANLPRDQMRASMADAQLDTLLKPEAFEQQRKTMGEGHCGLLPESQLVPMARIQVARDRAMARTVAQAARAGRTVLLVAGAGHVDTSLGVPQHLPPTLASRSLEWPKRPPQKDYCAELRQRMTPAKNQ
jgi:uncharacterized iron-regulated protein